MSEITGAAELPLLFTWVDVDEHFARLAAQGLWPSWLFSVSAYWDSLELTVDAAHSDRDEQWQWLMGTFGQLTVNREREVLFLEPYDHTDRVLTIEWDRVAAARFESSRDMRWREGRVTRDLAKSLAPPAEPALPHGVEMCAFHSFKGGVGRTLHCVALALTLAEQGRRVLLVDADLEAPGITWMVRAQGGRSDFGFADLLALLHGAVDSEITDALGLGRKFLANQTVGSHQMPGGITILPATRPLSPLGPPAIEPANLHAPNRSPYFLTESLARIAQTCDADTVLVDLRAGVSELSAPFLLDPRVRRVFISTLSEQSRRGTLDVIAELVRRAPARRDTDPVPAAIITQFDRDQHSDEYTHFAARLAGALADLAFVDGVKDPSAEPGGEQTATMDVTDRDLLVQPLDSPFNAALLTLGGSWDAVSRAVERAALRECVAPLAERFAAQQSAGDQGTQGRPYAVAELNDRRTRLAEVARCEIFAEATGRVQVVLPTASLTNLASQHVTQVPIQVVVGSKGSGKTFTYRLMTENRHWSDFGTAVGVAVHLASPIVPVLKPSSLEADRISQGAPEDRAARFLAVEELVTEACERESGELEWRRVWLTTLAMSLGLSGAAPDTAEDLLTRYVAGGGEAVFVIDGLEELFSDFATNAVHQRALSVLLTRVNDWLRALRGRPLGLVTFIRRDLVRSAVPQNTAQFFSRYKAYELSWSRDEALRLAVLVAKHAQAISDIDPRSTASGDPKPSLLELWGDRMGTPKSRDARSDEWFLSALSDFNQQIQARDVVSFLAEAATKSAEGNTDRWPDRVLTPVAMRAALPAVSREKIRALADETPKLGEIFRRLRELPDESRRLPCTLESTGLESDDAGLLVENGVLFREDDQYWIPEIYRHGLGFSFAGRGRPRILTVANLVRRSNDLGRG